MIDVILTENTRPACGGPFLIRYSSAGVYSAIAQKGLPVRWVDYMWEEKRDSVPGPSENSADVCCYAVFFGNKVSAFRHMQEVRSAKKAPRTIVAFGPFAAEFPEEILNRGLADMIVFADPEFVIPLILDNQNDTASLARIPNLAYLSDGEVVKTQQHSFHDLDSIPFVGPFLYEQGDRPAFMLTARGCQYHCIFCDRNALWGGGVRNRSVDHVLGEIRELVTKYQVREIRFLDEDLAADRGRLQKLCEGIRRIEGDFFWKCSACVNSVSEKLLLLMGHSRCRNIDFGVESASPDVLRRVGKKYTRQDIVSTVRWARAAGMHVEVMITTGNPQETDADRSLTLSLLKEIEPQVQGITTNRLVILPGTPIYRQALREGRFTEKSFFEDEGYLFYDEKEVRI